MAETVQTIEGLAEAQKITVAHMSPRYLELDRLERWVEGRQYDGWPEWFSSTRTPLMERAPCVRYLLAKDAIDSNVDLVLGEGRFPVFTTNPGEDDSAFDAELGLDEEDSKKLDRFIQLVVKQSRFKVAARDVFRDAQASRSGAMVLGARNGRLFAETFKAKWCEPEFDADRNCTKLTIQYPYVDKYQDERGQWKARARIFRREIDGVRDVTFLPAEATQSNTAPNAIKWVEDLSKTVEHGLGLCPVCWYAHMRGCEGAAGVDGHAIHELHTNEMHGVDLALSIRHRAALKASDPQYVLTGVSPETPLAETGRTAYPASRDGGPTTEVNPQTGGWGDGPVPSERSGPATKKGVDILWKIANKDAKAYLFTLPADALKAISEHAEDLVKKLAQNFAHVLLDPDNIKSRATMSGKAMEAFRERQLNRCDQYRDDLGDGLLVPALLMLLKIAARLTGADQKLRIKGLDTVKGLLAKYVDDDPDVTLVWGSYAKPDSEEEGQIVTAVVAASSAQPKLVTRRMALEKFKRHNIFAIENVEQALEDLEEEADEAMKQQQDLAHAMGTLVADGDSGDKGGAGGNAAPGAQKAPGARGGRPARTARKPGGSRSATDGGA